MIDMLNDIAGNMGVDARYLIVGGLFAGSLMVFLAIVGAIRGRAEDPVVRRMKGAGAAALAGGPGILLDPERDPAGLARAFLPTKPRERNQVRRDLEHAGFTGPNAVVVYYGIRIGFGLVLPALLAGLVLFRDVLPLPASFRGGLGQLGSAQLMIGFALVILLGFYGPAAWLSARTRDRRGRVEMAFPNALDLLQVSVEAGLGFDAALSRVAAEMEASSPEICKEFTAAQQEILAGRDREHAYRQMAERLGIEEAYAFINVILQSMRFGTSMGQALLAYSADMRQRREIRAQEKANKLPVYMSAVMAGLMMPALLIVTIGPVVIRYIDTFGD
jgi:tight adherence protein C